MTHSTQPTFFKHHLTAAALAALAGALPLSASAQARLSQLATWRPSTIAHFGVSTPDRRLDDCLFFLSVRPAPPGLQLGGVPLAFDPTSALSAPMALQFGSGQFSQVSDERKFRLNFTLPSNFPASQRFYCQAFAFQRASISTANPVFELSNGVVSTSEPAAENETMYLAQEVGGTQSVAIAKVDVDALSLLSTNQHRLPAAPFPSGPVEIQGSPRRQPGSDVIALVGTRGAANGQSNQRVVLFDTANGSSSDFALATGGTADGPQFDPVTGNLWLLSNAGFLEEYSVRGATHTALRSIFVGRAPQRGWSLNGTDDTAFVTLGDDRTTGPREPVRTVAIDLATGTVTPFGAAATGSIIGIGGFRRPSLPVPGTNLVVFSHHSLTAGDFNFCADPTSVLGTEHTPGTPVNEVSFVSGRHLIAISNGSAISPTRRLLRLPSMTLLQQLPLPSTFPGPIGDTFFEVANGDVIYQPNGADEAIYRLSMTDSGMTTEKVSSLIFVDSFRRTNVVRSQIAAAGIVANANDGRFYAMTEQAGFVIHDFNPFVFAIRTVDAETMTWGPALQVAGNWRFFF